MPDNDSQHHGQTQQQMGQEEYNRRVVDLESENRAARAMNNALRKNTIKMKLRHRPDLRAVLMEMIQSGDLEAQAQQLREARNPEPNSEMN